MNICHRIADCIKKTKLDHISGKNKFAIKTLNDQAPSEKCFSSSQGLLIKTLSIRREKSLLEIVEYTNSDILTEKINAIVSGFDFRNRVVIMMCANIYIHVENTSNELNNLQVNMVLMECDIMRFDCLKVNS